MGDRQRQVFRQHQKKENFKEKKMAQKRKALTLDLNAAAGVGPSGLGIFSKKSKLAASHILTSPDVQKLKLSSPELAEFLTRNPTLATPTPSGGNYIFPKTVTEEQESYVKGFEVALKNLQQHQIQEPQLKPLKKQQQPTEQQHQNWKFLIPRSILLYLQYRNLLPDQNPALLVPWIPRN